MGNHCHNSIKAIAEKEQLEGFLDLINKNIRPNEERYEEPFIVEWKSDNSIKIFFDNNSHLLYFGDNCPFTTYGKDVENLKILLENISNVYPKMNIVWYAEDESFNFDIEFRIYRGITKIIDHTQERIEEIKAFSKEQEEFDKAIEKKLLEKQEEKFREDWK
jgi:hypothetical protein